MLILDLTLFLHITFIPYRMYDNIEQSVSSMLSVNLDCSPSCRWVRIDIYFYRHLSRQDSNH